MTKKKKKKYKKIPEARSLENTLLKNYFDKCHLVSINSWYIVKQVYYIADNKFLL